jgi:hypothetical protein
MSYLRAYYAALLTASAAPPVAALLPPVLQYLWNPSALAASSASSVPNTGTAGAMTLTSTGAPIALTTIGDGLKAFNFSAAGDYFQSAGNFPVQKTNGPRTFYLAIRLDSDQSGDICSLGQASYYGANFCLSYDGQNAAGSDNKIMHLALAGMDMYPDVLRIGDFLTLAVRADPVDANTCRITVLTDQLGAIVQDFRWIDTDFAPFKMGSGTWNRRACDMSLALCGVNLSADSDKDMSNNLRQVQLACGLPARPRI